MLESMVSFLLSEHLAGKTLVPSEGDLGYDRMMTPNRKPHKTKDGYLVILPYSTRHWIRFFQLCELEDWATANKVVDPVLRSEHIDELYGKISELAPSKTTAEWLKVLAEQDIPCADVNSLDDIMTDEHLVAAQMFHQDTDPRIGDYLEIRPPFQVDGMLAHEEIPNTAAPGLGENNDDILNELGYSAEDINALRQDFVVG